MDRHIKAEDTRKIKGSVDVDTSLMSTEPNANRWDFGIAFKHSNKKNELIYWVETHTGTEDQIELVMKKLAWLKSWLRQGGKELANFECEFVWIPSGSTSFTKGSKQVKILAAKGLRYPGRCLQISNLYP